MRAAKKLQQKYPSLVVYIPSCRRAFDEIFKKAFYKYEVKGLVISQQDSCKIKALYLFASLKLLFVNLGQLIWN